jgi:hypothetical protein
MAIMRASAAVAMPEAGRDHWAERRGDRKEELMAKRSEL